MKGNRILVLIVLLTAIAASFHSVIYARSNSPLELTLSLDKNEYKKADGIVLSLSLKNTGKKAIYVNKRFFLNGESMSAGERDVYLTVESPSGEDLPCKVSAETGLPRTQDFILLEPGEEAKLEREKNIKYFFDFDELGKYKITAFYQNVHGEEIGVDAFKGKVISKAVIITIVE
ncbi:MAG: hypothetical protein P9L90_03695 [Candidatus Aadella gelida]|nr:hypothetical protein [Candidatus Aadella gelida]